MVDPKLMTLLNQNLCSIFLYYFFALLTSLFVIAPTYKAVFWLSELERKRRGNRAGQKYEELLPTRCAIPPMFLGSLEQFLYITTVIIGHPEFIAVWLAFKVVGVWKIWEGEKDRISYNMFTIGTALSILNALFWSLVISTKFLSQ